MRRHEAVVFIELAGETIPAGRLVMEEDQRFSRSSFSYGRRYLERENAVALDPVTLPLGSEKFVTQEDFALFNGIRDAAPDAFGRMLIDSFMIRTRNRPAGEAEFLLASRSGHRTGALRFGPDPAGPGRVLKESIPSYEMEIGELSAFQRMVEEHLEEGVLPERMLAMVAPGSDMGGARPKGTVLIDGFPWLAKFSKAGDRINNAAAEAGCLDLCEMAGIPVPERAIEMVAGKPVLLLRRFDREAAEEDGVRRRHMISSLTALGAHESDTGMSGYSDLYNAMRRIGNDHGAGRDIYRRMVMNVLCGNTDDHYRNHAFLLAPNGRYDLSPAYDVTPTLQASTSRNLFLHLGEAGCGRGATLEAAVEGGGSFGLSRDEAAAIADDLSAMVARHWRPVMTARGASGRDIEMMANSFSEAGKRIGGPEPDDCPGCR